MDISYNGYLDITRGSRAEHCVVLLFLFEKCTDPTRIFWVGTKLHLHYSYPVVLCTPITSKQCRFIDNVYCVSKTEVNTNVAAHFMKIRKFLKSAPPISIILTSSVTNIIQIYWWIIKLQVFQAICAWNQFYRFERIKHCSQWLPFLLIGIGLWVG